MQQNWENLVSEKAFAAACDVLRYEWGGKRAAVLEELFRLHRQLPLSTIGDVVEWIDELLGRGKISPNDRGMMLDTADRVVWELRQNVK